MKIQKSYQNEQGILYIVPTPIGNLEDITLRAIRLLKEADMIAAEDTRNTKKLLNHFEINGNLISYHEHNKETSGRNILERLLEGKTIALVSDAGTPAISDPGYELVLDAIKEGITVVSIPGANAALTALTASGITPQPFYFYGFLPRKKKDRDTELQYLKRLQASIIFYEAPHRLKDTLAALYEGLGDRKIVLGRELTKKFEEYVRGNLLEIIDYYNEAEIRGEFCIIIEGSEEAENTDEEIWWRTLSPVEHVDYYLNQGIHPKEAIKKVAQERGMGKRDVYQMYHVDGEGNDE